MRLLLTRWISSRLHKIPLRFVLLVPFVLQIVTAVSLVGYLSFRNGQKAIDDLAHQLMGELSDRIQLQLDTYLKTPPEAQSNQ